MANMDTLKSVISGRGVTLKHVAAELGVSRNTLYSKLDGSVEFKASEIVALAKTLRLNKEEIQHIFFD